MMLEHFRYVCLLIIFSYLREISCSGNCIPAKVHSCGKVPSIRYPFYIENKEAEPSCGYPGFNVSCNADGQPVLKLQDSLFVIRQINTRHSSVRIVRDVFSNLNHDSCIPTIHENVSFGGDFRLSGNQSDILLGYNCNSSARISATTIPFTSCSDKGTGESGRKNIAILNGEENAMKGCESVVRVPVNIGKGQERMVAVDELLSQGFSLNWSDNINCTLCQLNGGHCGNDYETRRLRCFCYDRLPSTLCQPSVPVKEHKDHRALKVGLGVGCGFLALMILAAIIFIYYRRRGRRCLERISTSSSTEPSMKEDVELRIDFNGIPVFSYSELEAATGNFGEENELGEGGFGIVYYGKLKDGREIAVKRMYEHSYRRVVQFMNEITILAKIRHKYLVSLYGCTSRRSRELLLVYEFVSNGTVFDHLHGRKAAQSQLTWQIRMNIAVETASALAYLHATDIIHRDVKTHNILLDHNFCVKVADFGLSRLFPFDKTHVSTAPQGTPGYVDPEYHQSYQLTDRSDVYSFGVVLIELVSSMPAVDITRDRSEINLASLALNRVQRGVYSELIDHRLGYGTNEEVTRMTLAVADLAFRCLQVDRCLRPTMMEVSEELLMIQNNAIKIQSSPLSSAEAPLLKNAMIPTSPTSVISKWTSNLTSAANSSNGSTLKD